ncbi:MULTISPECIES: hypothetical protein [Kocuria]|jgi:hypothetical protein|uniref:hypothetical protein n=1 Tax=Kocuria TaxID=57493 RepID=UPI000AB516D5|nr:hypothetical protein [Kocuria polaris]
MSKKKLTTAIASAALAASFIVGPAAPANALMVQKPQAPGYVMCGWFPFLCR